MRAEVRRQLMLAAVAFVMAFAIYRAWPDDNPAAAPTPTAATAGRTRSSAPGVPGSGAPEVHLRSLSDVPPKPSPSQRNLFTFRVRTPPPSPVELARRAAALQPAVSTGPPPPPPLPPIGYKFIGVVETTAQAARIAVLSDGKNVFHGREGDVIEGRYRILRIGAESIEMAYLDGRGRQTIRLTGS
jgi:hypothetical protein